MNVLWVVAEWVTLVAGCIAFDRLMWRRRVRRDVAERRAAFGAFCRDLDREGPDVAKARFDVRAADWRADPVTRGPAQ